MRLYLALAAVSLLCSGVLAQQQPGPSETTGTHLNSNDAYGRISSTDARARIEELGYSDVSDLREDERGGWQARAKRDGQIFAVIVDAEGNTFALSDG